MTNSICVLFLDSDPPLDDAIRAALRASGKDFDLIPLKSMAELDEALDGGEADVVLCSLHPHGIYHESHGPAGLRVLQQVLGHEKSIPFILLCPPEAEETHAGHAIWQGADDYLLNTALSRLPRAISSAVHHQRLLALRNPDEVELKLALAVLRGARDGICITDATATILMVNDTFCQITGYTKTEVIGKNPRILKSDLQDENFYRGMWESLTTQGVWQGDIHNQRKDGARYTEWLRISAVHDARGEVSHYIGQFGYLSEQKRLIERVNHLTQTDQLTGLPNRTLFLDRLEQSLTHTKRSTACTAIILISLDRFRQINDVMGQSMGDHVLIEIAQRFKRQVRQGDTVARLSGNEFSFLLTSLSAAEDALRLAARIQASISEPVDNGKNILIVTASIGISISPRDGTDAETLLRAADAALIRAKTEGGGALNFYSPEMNASAQRRQAIESAMRTALDKQEFSVVYQPQNNLDTGNIIGTEALLRWHSSELGQISPAEFIPIAEETGMIIPIGLWVLREACAQNKAWQDLGLASIRVAVNLSARQFRGSKLLEEVALVLKETGLPPEYLELEVTESSLIHNIDEAAATCRKLKAMGLKLSLDDFGTGYSSLAYVARFPFDKLKIDQAFIKDITHNPANAAIANAAIAIARGLNLSVLAEGVETEAQAFFLRSRHCDAIQGYLFSRPIPPDALSALLNSRARLRLGGGTADKKQTLLIVDDEASILSAMNRLFRHENYNVITAQTANEAFELIAKTPAQVIISDQRMAGMTGTEFFTRVRQLYPDSIRIILSGYTELNAVMEAINHGAVYKFLTKPWEDDQLRELIREAFRTAAQKGRS